MTRRNALVRLHEALLARKDGKGKKLERELAHMHNGQAANSTGDSADLAFEADGDEMSFRLAELDNRELSQVEQALTHWNQGTYGICENCQRPISLARLNALPYAPFCIICVRDLEKHLDGQGRQTKGNWGQVADAQALMQDQRLSLSELERDLAGGRRS